MKREKKRDQIVIVSSYQKMKVTHWICATKGKLTLHPTKLRSLRLNVLETFVFYVSRNCFVSSSSLQLCRVCASFSPSYLRQIYASWTRERYNRNKSNYSEFVPRDNLFRPSRRWKNLSITGNIPTLIVYYARSSLRAP